MLGMWVRKQETTMRYLITLLAAVASVLSASAAYADIGDQLAKLLARDVAESDNFGATAIVGAWRDDDNGSGSGSAYLFDITDPANPVQVFKLLPDDGAAGDVFGWSVAISPDGIGTAIVGAYKDDDNGDWSGSAYLFDTTTGQQIAKLLPDDGAAGDRFGYSVAISGATAIIGAWLDDDNGTDSGSAYLFDTPTGPQIAKLLADDGAPTDTFGFSVAIRGAIAIVGAKWDDTKNGSNSGSAYLFDISDAAKPTQIAQLLPDDGAPFGVRFGMSVAISGAIAVVGTEADDDNGSWSGSAYLFDISDPANPTQIAKLLANDGAAEDFFGWSVAISGAPGEEIAIVGAQRNDDNGDDSGSAYLLDAAAPGMCPWDLDDSGDVGVKDLLFLLGTWGPCPPKGDCPADFDNTGDVGVKDLLFLLGAWGSCP